MDILLSVTLLLLILCIIALYLKSTHGLCKSKKRLDGKTCLVTGGTSGIGLEVSIDLASRGARLIIACPFNDEGDTAKQRIVEESGNENVVFKFLDLGSFESVRKFAADINENEDRLDILMNNAGVGIPKATTDDGFDIIMQVNYLGHFLLTILLLPLLKKSGTPSAPSRIVNTSSILHRTALFQVHEIKDVDANFIQRLIVYSNSKLCLLLFSRELTKRLTNSNVVINNADPGEVSTRILYSAGIIIGSFIYLYSSLFSKTPFGGAQTLLHAALDDKAGDVTNEFFRGCRMCEPSSAAKDDFMARSLWEESVECVKLSKMELDMCLNKNGLSKLLNCNKAF